MCDACESPIAKNQMAVEGFAFRIADLKSLRVHASCSQIWDAERRPGLLAPGTTGPPYPETPMPNETVRHAKAREAIRTERDGDGRPHG
jgi:hypothetical protein